MISIEDVYVETHTKRNFSYSTRDFWKNDKALNLITIVPASYSFEQCHYAMLYCTYLPGLSSARASTETTIGLISCILITIIRNKV